MNTCSNNRTQVFFYIDFDLKSVYFKTFVGNVTGPFH